MPAPRPYGTDPFRLLSSINKWWQFVFKQHHSSYFLHLVRSSVSCGGGYLTIAHALLKKHSYFRFRAIISLVCFSLWYALVHIGTKYMTSTHVHSLYKQNSPLSRLDFFFGSSCEGIVRLSI